MSDESSERLINLGPISRRMMEAAGIRTFADLQRIGSVRAFLAVKAAGQKPSLNLLWALEGAVRNEHWNSLPESVRSGLKAEIKRQEALD